MRALGRIAIKLTLRTPQVFTTETLALETETLERTASLYINEHSAKCARLSCGGVIEMCEAVASGRVRNGFAVVRPPGHHAEPDRSMGFCLYNNVAVATRYLQRRYGDYEGRERVRKVLILDWDVHHGNGTQQAFWDDENVLYISLHRYENGEFFPGGIGGADDQVGVGAGVGRNVNIPWPDSGMGDGDYLAAFQRIVMPIAHEFAPDFVIISAGFDAAEGDHLGQCRVTPNGYAQMTHELAALANGRLVVALEPTSAQDGFGSEEDSGVPLVQLPELIKAHRLQAIARKYQLGTLPVLTQEGAGFFDGSVLTSMDLLDKDPAYETVVVFAHDMGNLRAEIPLFEIYADRERAYMVDASSKIIDWAMERGHAIIDVNVDAQLPTTIKPPVLTGGTRPRIGTLASERANGRRNQAREALLYVWDNFVDILRHATPDADKQPRVVLIGHGTACEAVLQLIEERHVEAAVRAVVQVPAHSTIPAIAKGNPEKRKWYWNRSKVILPYSHALYSFGEQERLGKRLGKTERSSELATS
ncbi:hypothetical protein L7F22_047083 [Adiantum nelumboides]|nr:hypothetical protein [Adiantum nelumboides]